MQLGGAEQSQPVPDMDWIAKAAGAVSVTVTVPEVVPAPAALETVIV
jgi:hypothetical protein